MTIGDYGTIAGAVLAGVGLIGGWNQRLHNLRKTLVEQRFEHISGQITRLDTDMGGLTTQLGATVADVEKRFLAKTDFTATVDRLDDSIGDLNKSIGRLTDHIIDLARDRAERAHDPHR